MRAWFHEAKNASWKTPAELKAQFQTVAILKDGCTVFALCGNKFRLVVRLDYRAGIIMLRWIGTRAQYDRIQVEGT